MDSRELRSQLERHHRESYGWALGCCRKDPAEAESVLQVSYLKILESQAVFNGRAAFKTWLFSVIRKTAAQRRRWKTFQRLKLVPYEQVRARASPETPPDAAAYRSEIQQAQSRFTDLQWKLQDEMEKLVSLTKPPRVDEQQTLEQLEKLLGVEREVTRAQLGLMIRIKNNLTPEQQSRLQEIKSKSGGK